MNRHPIEGGLVIAAIAFMRLQLNRTLRLQRRDIVIGEVDGIDALLRFIIAFLVAIGAHFLDRHDDFRISQHLVATPWADHRLNRQLLVIAPIIQDHIEEDGRNQEQERNTGHH